MRSLHAGGGYALGACNQQLNTVAATAAAANLTIICPDYRLTPEHPFPAGLRDALAVYKVSTLWITTIFLSW
jgi:acetyl esterase/lipase